MEEFGRSILGIMPSWFLTGMLNATAKVEHTSKPKGQDLEFLLPTSSLTPNLMPLPYSPTNCCKVKYGDGVHCNKIAGDAAVDFKLLDLEGQPVILSELLKTKPVLLVIASYTCPVFQDQYFEQVKLAKKHAGKAHLIHVVSNENHPKGDPSITVGSEFVFRYSDARNPITYDERKKVSAARVQQMLKGSSWTILVDDIDLKTKNINPVYYTYGPGSYTVHLIRQDGIIFTSHTWPQWSALSKMFEIGVATEASIPHQNSFKAGLIVSLLVIVGALWWRY
jgi:hypothetical protein